MTRPPATDDTVYLRDDFDVPVREGEVVGSVMANGQRRAGVDVEGLMSIDDGALRMRPLVQPGWGRQGLAYGPVRREPGLALTVHVLNGHQASQTFYVPETAVERARRVLGNVRHGRWSQVRPRPRHLENLAVGFLDDAAPRDPLRQGHAVVVHSATEDNGELWVGCGGRALRALRGVQNVPLSVVIILREQGAAYYAAALPGDADLPSLPDLRPLGIDPVGAEPELYPGVHQRILGEVGYVVDTRVYRVSVDAVPAWTSWWGTAHAADRMGPGAPRPGRAAELGGTWAAWDDGVVHGSRTLVLDPGVTSGLVHVLVGAGRRPHSPFGLVWRASPRGGWRVLVGQAVVRLQVKEQDQWRTLARTVRPIRSATGLHTLQVVDDGKRFGVHLDGHLLFKKWFDDARHGGGTMTGVCLSRAGSALVTFEAHPRAVSAQREAGGAWPGLRVGARKVLDTHFEGPPVDLDGVREPSGEAWQRTTGTGRIHLTGQRAAAVQASVAEPNPGRTVYTVPWHGEQVVDLELVMTPPGTRRGQGHDGRGGVVVWQDPDHFVIVNLWLDDWFPGASISSFYRLDGREDMYHAVWTLVGDGVTWGRPFVLRLLFDGQRLLALVDGRPCLYRALRDIYPDASDLRVTRVGIVANEEWGDDTGTTFHRFTTRSGAGEEVR